MNRDLVKNLVFIVIGAILVVIVELKLFQNNQTLMLILGLIGFVALVDGVFGLYNIIKNGQEVEEPDELPPK